MDGSKVSVKKMMEMNDVLTYLQDLIDGFKAGKIVVQRGDEFVTLTPPQRALVEVEAKMKEDSQKFALEISWKPEEYLEKLKAPLTISQTEPEKTEDEENEEEEEETEEEEEADEDEEDAKDKNKKD